MSSYEPERRNPEKYDNNYHKVYYHKGADEQTEGADNEVPMSLHDLLQTARSHESTPVPFDRRLRICTWLSLLICLGAVVGYLMLGQVKAEVGHNGFFIVMGDMFDEQIRLVQRSLTWLVCLNAIYILLTVISMIMTANFRKGREEWQVIVFGQTLFGCFNIVCFTYLLAAFVVNLVIWAALLTLLAGIAFGLFRLVRLR